MATNRRVFRNGVAPCVVGVFVALFSASALGEEEQCSKVYSLAKLTAEGVSRAGMKGCMRVLLVPHKMIDTHTSTGAWDGSAGDFGVVAITYKPESTQRVPEYTTILSLESGEVSTSDKVEPLVALGSKAWHGNETSEYEVVDSPFSIAEDAPTLQCTEEGKSISMDLAMIKEKLSQAEDGSTLTLQCTEEGKSISMDLATIEEKLSQTKDRSTLTLQGAGTGELIKIDLAKLKEDLSQTFANCFAYDPWSACFKMAMKTSWGDSRILAYGSIDLKKRYSELFTFENEKEYKGRGIWVSSPAERLTKN